MPQYLLLGDSNFFWSDYYCSQEPWSSLQTEETTATFICRLLDTSPIFYPILKGLQLDWVNCLRLQSLITVMEDCKGSKHDIHLLLWIGQNAAHDVAQMHESTDAIKSDIHRQVDEFVSKLTEMYKFRKVYIIGYHNHSKMEENGKYMQASEHVLGRMLNKMPNSIFIPMMDTVDDMYADTKHLKIPFQFEVAKHVFAHID